MEPSGFQQFDTIAARRTFHFEDDEHAVADTPRQAPDAVPAIYASSVGDRWAEMLSWLEYAPTPAH